LWWKVYNPIHSPRTLEDYVEFLQMGNHIPKALVNSTGQDVCLHVLIVLESILREHMEAVLLLKWEAIYIYDAVKDKLVCKEWI
jgi:hypothetical protein